MEVNIKDTKKVNAKVLKTCVKCSDSFSAILYDEVGNVLKDYDGYVPSFMPGNHYGDYIMINIDIETGEILNWDKPTPEEIEEFIGDGEDH